MNRTGLGLAVGAGYFLGRTRKLKLAIAVGSLVAGKRLNLTPKGIADLVSQQLRDNPQFKEIGDQLRQDLRGVGKAASGAMVERQMEALADRLHGRTAEVRDQLEGVVPGGGGEKSADDEADEEYEEPRNADEDEEPQDTSDEDEEPQDTSDEDGQEDEEEEEPPRKRAAKKAPAKKTAKKAPAKKAPAKKAPARGTAAKKTASAQRTGARTASGTASRARRSKGGGDR
ncbi:MULTISPECIES: DNA primase [unclassified Streptomyces]|uniref:DNA primase n=1 Tax=unclassified Streptomyces TaxID=2593676 RepID=UPI0037FEEED4